MLEALIKQHGMTGKLVRAICHANGWKYKAGSPPEEYYHAWRNGLSDEINSLISPNRYTDQDLAWFRKPVQS